MEQFPALRVQPLHGEPFSLVLRKDVTTIGRSWQNDLVLADPWLSRRHAEIRREVNDYYAFDLNSRNGTLINGVRVQKKVRLHDGDLISLGDHRLTFHAQPPDPVVWDEGAGEFEAGHKLLLPSPQMLAASGDREGSTWDCFEQLQATIERQAIAPDAPGMLKEAAMVRALSEASMAVVSERALPELLDFILDLVFKVVPAERGFVLLAPDDLSQLEVKAVRLSAPRRQSDREITFSRSIAEKVLRDHLSILTSNATSDPRIPPTDSIADLRIRSAMCVPLWGSQRVIGLLYVDSLDRENAFSQQDLQLLSALAGVAAVKIDNARLQEQMVDKERTEHELALAAEIQRNLLPREPPHLPGWDIAGTSRPCYMIGGDYYDFVWRPDGRLAFALGDVAGKGAGAALMMTVLRATLRTYAEQPTDLTSVLHRTNRVMKQNSPPHSFITLFLGELDARSAELAYVNAGHLPPILFRPETDALVRLEEGGTVLGLFETPSFGVGRAALEPGDVVVVFTDGVSESWDADGSEFGETRLADVIRRYAAFSSRDIIDAIQSSVDQYSGGAHPTDDRTLIVVKRLRE